MTSRETPLETSAAALTFLDVGDVLEELRRAPAFLGRERDEVVETVGGADDPKRAQARMQCRQVAYRRPSFRPARRGCRRRRGGADGRPGRGPEIRRAGP